ncbi:MAG TPA: hypothetical protein H9716_03405 [Candidatus Enterocloster faecavium]|uniref:Lipoprotein n=1 Tax=Candidatus Enterocloster faecavium TaxID=2838560 RepID=A0A9D2RLG5_9FIRM|nr:hypothetical protein [Candidatus Enterocloster faecavium]
MKKAAFALIISLQIVSASGCIYSNNYDENGQEMNEEQVKEAIDDIRESVAGQIGSAVSEQNTGTDKNTTGNGGEADNTTNSDKEAIFRFCQDELGEMEEIHFETYDTGTMAADGWEKCSSIDVVHSLLLSSTPLCPSKDS